PAFLVAGDVLNWCRLFLNPWLSTWDCSTGGWRSFFVISGETLTSLWYAATWIGLQLLTALAFNAGPGMLQIAIWTHIGGFLTGLVAARLWGKGPLPF
ncbi:rhomboid family intramembrane serine protease, partial [Nostoc sp. HG1]|nr:rhomboid family intramembrane serine protease [Nostoc sp. HG1]